jgi:hypothetical protein
MSGIEQEDDWYSLGQIGQYITDREPRFRHPDLWQAQAERTWSQSLKTLEVKRGPGNQLAGAAASTDGVRRGSTRDESSFYASGGSFLPG